MKFVLDCFSVGFVGNKRRRMNDDFQFFFHFEYYSIDQLA
mgnify:CR=1 FL=1